ncbi:hypothetical protein QTP86_033807, partial [Hemibagrus guttatus]
RASIHSLEEAVKPANFSSVVQAVKTVSGFDEEMKMLPNTKPSLKIGAHITKDEINTDGSAGSESENGGEGENLEACTSTPLQIGMRKDQTPNEDEAG